MRRPYTPTLGRKQDGDSEAFAQAWKRIRFTVPRWWVDMLIERAAAKVHHWHRIYGGRMAYGWSGGKDSIALRAVMDAAGVRECALVITRLEYPAFLQWCTEWMPDGLTVVDRERLDLAWLLKHPDYLFPQDSRWFEPNQRAGLREYIDTYAVRVLAVGRRRADGNNAGECRVDRRGRAWVAPLWAWTHEDVLATCAYYGPPLPPQYGWPRGWAVGTGPWPARQWVRSREQGWAEVRAIDPEIAEMGICAGLPPV